MAEGLARHLARERGLDLGFMSAGVIARNGMPATDHARAVLAEKGIDISAHQARRLDAEIIAKADIIIALEEEHRLAVREFPESSLKPLRLLSEWAGEPELGPGIEDPIGGAREEYRETADEIEAYLKRALDNL
jgi:protein-tyrosine-phosphatase